MANNWKKVKRAISPSAVLIASVLITGLACGGLFLQLYQGKIFPGVFVGSINVSGLSQDQAALVLQQQLVTPTDETIQLVVDDISVASTSADLGVTYNLPLLVNQAYAQGRTGTWPQQFTQVVRQWWQPTVITPLLTLDENQARAAVATLAAKVDYPGEPPAALLKTSGNAQTLTIFAGKSGRQVLVDETLTLLKENVARHELQTGAAVASSAAELSPTEIVAANERAKRFVGQTAVFTAGDITLKLPDKELLKLVAFPEGFNETALADLMSDWTDRVARPAREPVLTYNHDTLAVSAFTPPLDGLTLDKDDAREQLTFALSEIEKQAQKPLPTFPLKVAVDPPKTSLNSLNNIGISEKVGFGESWYAHSIPTRIHNVALAASRINNHIVKPGEEFRFNDTLGDVSKETGFQPAYVIKSGQTVLGDGGGVCQVSTTVFRAILNAGLPITKRRAHSYRVSYYELDSKPGVDATVYAGDVDLRFKNDTGHAILIHTETDSKNLYMKVELYGTSDGRTAQIIDHKTWDPRPAPPTEYITDPSLPPGTKKQVDWSASGIKASFKNVVKDKNGTIIRTDEYYSNYIPWSAKYLVGI